MGLVNFFIIGEGENSVNGGNAEENNVPEPTVTPTFAPTVAPNTVQTDPTYFIKVNYGANVVTIYMKDSSTGEYTVPVKAMVCSTRKRYTNIWNI